ncbi:hypothetical protein, partial [Helicobacter sp. MIT 01-3238]|uniref:hypothetical protein n=1 Tax=Helicobacter sp. MIT 01-3238 TaxID=398627 RepID=UPI000E360E97
TANNANASTSVITKETVLRLFCERAKRAWQSIRNTLSTKNRLPRICYTKQAKRGFFRKQAKRGFFRKQAKRGFFRKQAKRGFFSNPQNHKLTISRALVDFVLSFRL